MAIRIRVVDGTYVALCAQETDKKDKDVYLNDAIHYALAAKFALDWQGQMVDWPYDVEWPLMANQKIRDAEDSFYECDGALWPKEADPNYKEEKI